MKIQRNPAQAGIEAAEMLNGDILAGIAEEYDSEQESADFDEYVADCTPHDLNCGSKERARWQAAFCKAAGARAVELYRERTAQ